MPAEAAQLQWQHAAAGALQMATTIHAEATAASTHYIEVPTKYQSEPECKHLGPRSCASCSCCSREPSSKS